MPRINWTLELLRESASKYATRGEWKTAFPSAYKAALNRGILDVVCSHMHRSYKSVGHWTKANVLISARKFNSVAELNEAETTALQRARKFGWLDEATAHMDSNSVPIGPLIIHKYLLTHDIQYESEKRFKEFSEVSKKPFDFFIPSLNLLVEYHGKQHQFGWRGDLDSKTIIQLNDKIKKEWALDNGYNFLEISSWIETSKDLILESLERQIQILAAKQNILLSNKTRSLTNKELSKLHSGVAFSEEFILADAKKYLTRADWMRNSMNAYRFAIRHQLDAIATQHMHYVTEHGKWTKDAILASAKSFKTIAEWRLNEGSAYVIASRNGYLEEIKKFLTSNKKPNGFWTKEKIIESASQYTRLVDWRKSEPSAVVVARRNGWIKEAKTAFRVK